jgi:hypothetical protein
MQLVPDPRDSIWSFIQTVVAVIAILISVATAAYFYWIGRPQKELSYEIVSNTSLVPAQAQGDPNLQIVYKGIVAPEAHLLIIRVWNSGNTPITIGDFAQPIIITTGETELLSTAIVEQKPPNLIPAEWSP